MSAYRPEFDVLRFVAFALVFAHHVLPRVPSECPASLGSGGCAMLNKLTNMCGYGLSLFFLLSAFLITDLLLREKARFGDIAIRDFYVRRILRIWPLYFAMLAVGLSFELLMPSRHDAIMLGMYALMIGNWFFSFFNWSAQPVTPLWSISIEEQFYLLWPVAMRHLGRRGRYVLCGGLVVLAIGVQIGLGRAHAQLDTTVWTNSFVQFETFAAGAVLALALEGRRMRLRARARVALAMAGLGLWCVAVFGFAAKTIGPAESAASLVAGTACAVLGTAAMLLSVLGLKVPAASRWAYLGKISFGLYVFHMIFLDCAKIAAVSWDGIVPAAVSTFPLTLLSIGPTILAAHLSYRHFESRFLRLKQRFTRVSSRPVDDPPGIGARRTGMAPTVFAGP